MAHPSSPERGIDVALLDEGWPQTLYLAAGLARAGLRVHIASSEYLPMRLMPRAIRFTKLVAVNHPSYDLELDAALRSPLPTAVVPLTESVQARLRATETARSPRREPWRDRIFPVFGPAQLALLRDKRVMSELVASIGEPIPRQCALTSADEMDTAIEALGLPLVMKGPAGCGGSDVRIVRSAPEAREAYRALAARINRNDCGPDARAFAQEYVEGTTYMVGGLFRGGSALRLWMAEKVELHPALTGPSTVVRTVENPELRQSALAIFAALRIEGLASADFVRGGDGVFRFLEVNPRPWGAIVAALPTGVDFFTPFAQMLRGEAPVALLPPLRPSGRIALFPQFLRARLVTGGVNAVLRALADPAVLRGIPWRTGGRLVLSCLHLLYWSRHRATPVGDTSADERRPAMQPPTGAGVRLPAGAGPAAPPGLQPVATRPPSESGTRSV